MRDYRRQKVWQKAHELVRAVYAATRSFPQEELLGLTNQVRWTSMSIAIAIVEGCSRDSDNEFCKRLESAAASANELEYYLLLSKDLEFLDGEGYQSLSADLDAIKQELTALVQRYSAERAAKRTNFPF